MSSYIPAANTPISKAHHSLHIMNMPENAAWAKRFQSTKAFTDQPEFCKKFSGRFGRRFRMRLVWDLVWYLVWDLVWDLGWD